MSTVTELKPVQGCMRVAFDDAPSLRIRKCHFAKLPFEETHPEIKCTNGK